MHPQSDFYNPFCRVDRQRLGEKILGYLRNRVPKPHWPGGELTR